MHDEKTKFQGAADDYMKQIKKVRGERMDRASRKAVANYRKARKARHQF